MAATCSSLIVLHRIGVDWWCYGSHNVHDKELIVSNKYSIVTVPTISNSIINFTMVVIRISLKMILEKNSRLFD